MIGQHNQVRPLSKKQITQNIFPLNESLDTITNLDHLLKWSHKYYNYYKNQKATLKSLDSVYMGTLKYLYDYDVNGNIYKAFRYKWNINSSVWEVQEQIEYSNFGNTITTSVANSSNQLILDRKQVNTYNSNNQLITSEIKKWKVNKWTDSEITEYTYTTFNKVNTMISKDYGGQWYNRFKTIYSYNSNEDCILKLVQFGSPWHNSEKFEYTLNNDGFIIKDICSEWYSNWELLCKSEITRDVNNNMTQDYIYFWLINKWDPDQILNYSYDSNSNLIETVHSGFNTQGQPAFYSKNIRTYDMSINSNNLILPPQYIEIMNNKLDSIIFYSYSANTWTQGSRYTYYYSNTNTSISYSSKESSISVYPNPSSDYINFDLKKGFDSNLKVEIFSISGEKVLNRGDVNNRVCIKHLTQGVYFLKAIYKGEIIYKKIIKN